MGQILNRGSAGNHCGQMSRHSPSPSRRPPIEARILSHIPLVPCMPRSGPMIKERQSDDFSENLVSTVSDQKSAPEIFSELVVYDFINCCVTGGSRELRHIDFADNVRPPTLHSIISLGIINRDQGSTYTIFVEYL